MRDLIITLPAKISWTDYAKELQAVAEGPDVLNFRLPSLPRESGVGARCYLVHRGEIIGYMRICGLQVRDAFTCGTTGIYWPAGPYVQRNGPFWFFKIRPPKKGFQGYAYYDQAHDESEFVRTWTGRSFVAEAYQKAAALR